MLGLPPSTSFPGHLQASLRGVVQAGLVPWQAKEAGWCTEQGQWVYQKWSPTNQGLEEDAARPPLQMSDKNRGGPEDHDHVRDSDCVPFQEALDPQHAGRDGGPTVGRQRLYCSLMTRLILRKTLSASPPLQLKPLSPKPKP